MDQIGHAIHEAQNALGSLTAPKITEHEHEVQHKVAEHDRLEHEHEMEERHRHEHEHAHEQAPAAGTPMKETAATASADKPAEFHDARGAEEQEAKQEETEATAAPEGEGGM